MVDPFGIVGLIIGFLAKIEDMVATFSTNAEDCGRILMLVEIVRAVVEPLKQIEEREGVSAALKGLQGAVDDSLKVVGKCPKKSAIRRCIEAKDIARDLRQARKDISTYVKILTLAIVVGIALRLEVKNEKDNVPAADIETPRPSLSPDAEKEFEEESEDSDFQEKDVEDFEGSAKSTSAKTPIGQDGPCIAIKMISSSTEDVTSIDVHPTKPWIVMGHTGGNVCIWDYQKQETVMEKSVTKGGTANLMHVLSQYIKEKPPKHSVCSAKFITRKNWLVVGDGSGYIHVYDYTNTELPEVKKFKAPDGESVGLLAVHPTKTYLLSSSASGRMIYLWDWSSDDWKNKHEFNIKCTYPDGVLSLKFNPRDSNTFACVTDDRRLMVGNIKPYSLTTKLKGLSKDDYYFFNHTDQHLMMVTLSNAEIRDLETGKVVGTLGVSGRRTELVAGHPTLPILVTALGDGTVCFWNANTYRLEKEVRTDGPADELTFVTDVNDITRCSTSASKTRLAVTCKSGIAVMEVSYLPTSGGLVVETTGDIS